MMHALMGWLGAYFFTLSIEGIGMAVLVVCVTQAVDQIRLRKEAWSAIESIPEAEQKEARQQLETNINKKMALLYAQNVAKYAVVVVVVAEMGRTQGWL
jgi:hypothetical protein